MEIWVKLDNEEILDDYMISSYGNVFRISSNNFLKVKNDSENYIQRSFKCKNGKRKMFLVHRLVAQTFIPNPNNYPCVDHIDRDRQNNNVSNLRWCSFKQNTHFWLDEKKEVKQ